MKRIYNTISLGTIGIILLPINAISCSNKSSSKVYDQVWNVIDQMMNDVDFETKSEKQQVLDKYFVLSPRRQLSNAEFVSLFQEEPTLNLGSDYSIQWNLIKDINNKDAIYIEANVIKNKTKLQKNPSLKNSKPIYVKSMHIDTEIDRILKLNHTTTIPNSHLLLPSEVTDSHLENPPFNVSSIPEHIFHKYSMSNDENSINDSLGELEITVKVFGSIHLNQKEKSVNIILSGFKTLDI